MTAPHPGRLARPSQSSAVRRGRHGLTTRLRRLVSAAVLALTTTIAAPTATHAQSAGGGPLLQQYSFDDPEAAGLESIRLLTIPWAVQAHLPSNVSLSLAGSYASGAARSANGGEASLTGPTDTDLSIGWSVDDWLVVNAEATLATGKSTLSTEESLVAGVIAADLLPFSINTWGSGRSMGGSAAVATQAGSWGLGLAAGYRRAGEFAPIPGEQVRYDPGDHVRARLAADRNVGLSSTLSFVLSFQHFTDDRLEGTNLFQAGSRIQGLVSVAFPLGLRSSALVYGGVNHRSRGTLLLEEALLSGATDTPSQQLFLMGTNVRMPLGRRAALLPHGEIRVFRASDGASQGWVGSVGTSVDVRLLGNSASRRLMLSPSAALRLGNVIVEDGVEAGFSGWEAGLVLRMEGE